MLKTLRNAWKVSDIRTKLLITLALLMVYRAGAFIPVPDINRDVIEKLLGSGALFGFLDVISGGAFKSFSIFALGVVPYINSSIVMSLLTIAIPSLEQLSKEGEDGRRKIAEYTRYGTILFCLIQAFGTSIYLKNNGALVNNSWFNIIVIVLTLITGTTIVMWLGEKITEFGIGNGTSLIVFAGIISRLPDMVIQVQKLLEAEEITILHVALFIAFAVIVIAGVVAMDLAERRVPVQYAQKRVGTKTFGNKSTHIPINVNSAGVIAIIFAMSVMQFPKVITQLTLDNTSKAYEWFNTGWLSDSAPLYPILYIILIIFFTWFYTSVTFKPDEVAENLQKSGGFIPGLRPGKPTEEYLTRIINRMTFIGGVFAAIVAVMPIYLYQYSKFGPLQFGGTSILIVVGVALEMKKQVKAQLVMRHYEGFLK